jgi:hypothetical protein
MLWMSFQLIETCLFAEKMAPRNATLAYMAGDTSEGNFAPALPTGFVYHQAVSELAPAFEAGKVQRKKIVQQLRKILKSDKGLNGEVNVVAGRAYHDLFSFYTSTDYGRMHFEWTAAERIVASRLDWVS